MKLSADFRRIARNALKGKWVVGVIVGLVAALLGAGSMNEPELKINIDLSNAGLSFNYAGKTIASTRNGLDSPIGEWIAGNIGWIWLALIALVLIDFVLGSFVAVGYAKFNLNLVDNKSTAFETLFAYFSYWKTTAVAKLLCELYVFLWTLLLFIPGIVASFSYVLKDYIIADYPEITPIEALQQSKEMMRGNRWRCFCLQISFIGWDILAILTFGVGHLWLTPYKQAAYAAFYREVSGTELPVNDLY